MKTTPLEKAQAIAARCKTVSANGAPDTCGRTLNIGFFFDGFGRELEKDRLENRLSNIGRLFWVHPEAPNDDTFNLYRKFYLPGLGADYNAPLRATANAATKTSLEAMKDTVKSEGIKGGLEAGKDMLSNRSWWERLTHDLSDLKANPLKGIKVLKDAAIGTAAEVYPPLRDSPISGTLLKSGANTRLEGALARFRKDYAEAKSSSDIPLRWVKVSVFGFDFGATLARAFLNALNKEETPGTEVQLLFAGLFDGVDRSAASNPILEFFLPFKNDLDDGGVVPKKVRSVLHLIAAHERRFYRRVRLLGPMQRGWSEELMPGVSEDIGGGLAPREQKISAELAMASLYKMYKAAYKAGVRLPPFETLYELDADTAELFTLNDKLHNRSAVTLAGHYLNASGQHKPGYHGFTQHMCLYIRWLAQLWGTYQASLKALGDEEDRLHASQFADSGSISGLLGIPSESAAKRHQRLERTQAIRAERNALNESLSWLNEVNDEALSLHSRFSAYGVQAAGGNLDRYNAQRKLLNEWFTREPDRLEPGVRALFAHFMHDKLVLSEAQTHTRWWSGENYFDIRGFDLPDSKSASKAGLIRSLPTALTPYS